MGPSWPWSYGSWIYNYLCNQCLSPLMLWIQILIRVRCTTLCDKVCQWLVTGQRFSLGPLVSSTNKTDCIWYSWNIVESGIKHHQANKQLHRFIWYLFGKEYCPTDIYFYLKILQFHMENVTICPDIFLNL